MRSVGDMVRQLQAEVSVYEADLEAARLALAGQGPQLFAELAMRLGPPPRLPLSTAPLQELAAFARSLVVDAGRVRR